MTKIIRILEVPLLMLVMAIGTYSEGSFKTAAALLAVSITRLIVNTMTDDSIYKNLKK
jgi:hypothetical protein|tara:strand:- start:438 stop:611 length:174 start_codon:yes stop_codon:yes gene_type:complete